MVVLEHNDTPIAVFSCVEEMKEYINEEAEKIGGYVKYDWYMGCNEVGIYMKVADHEFSFDFTWHEAKDMTKHL